MQIETIAIENYRLFRKAILRNLPRMCVVVGANGSGKSTLFDVFSFLKDALAQNVNEAVARRGGFRELVSRGQSGPIRIELKFRESGGRLATYELQIAAEAGRSVVQREILKLHRDSYSTPMHLVDFSRSRGSAIINEAVHRQNEAVHGQDGVKDERKEYALNDPSVLAIKGLGQFKEFRVASEFRSMIENWHISHFDISRARQSTKAGHAEHLSAHGENVAQVVQYMFEHHRERFNQVLELMRRRVPGLTHVEAKATEDGRLILRFQDDTFKDPFLSRHVSDGTIKMFAYLLLLHDPRPHPLLAVAEPENQLYPELMQELAEEFRDYARRGGQVFVSTHSPDFLNGVRLEEIYWLVKRDGFTSVHRASESETLRNLVEAGDLPGQLWQQGLFEVPSHDDGMASILPDTRQEPQEPQWGPAV